jgi:hypothetical protein
MHKYKSLGRVGEGTFSEVIKAQSIKTGTYMAIKCASCAPRTALAAAPPLQAAPHPAHSPPPAPYPAPRPVCRHEARV